VPSATRRVRLRLYRMRGRRSVPAGELVRRVRRGGRVTLRWRTRATRRMRPALYRLKVDAGPRRGAYYRGGADVRLRVLATVRGLRLAKRVQAASVRSRGLRVRARVPSSTRKVRLRLYRLRGRRSTRVATVLRRVRRGGRITLRLKSRVRRGSYRLKVEAGPRRGRYYPGGASVRFRVRGR
jgi:hypothetical protein